jgi:hypothetical protein
MNNLQIDKILKVHPSSKRIFIETMPCDKSPQEVQSYPYAYVLNTDYSVGPGIHWVALFVLSEDQAEYFDSFGMPPNDCIKKFLEKFQIIKRSTIRLQAYSSSVCGQYCIYFMIRRCAGERFEKIINTLKNINANNRDAFIRQYANLIEKCSS